MVNRVAASVVALLALAVLAPVVRAQERPRYGGELAFFKFQSMDVSHVNYGRYTDREERRRHIREFEKRLLNEEVRSIFTFQWHRIVPHNARVRGWTITPSHFLNNQLDTVWPAE